jgi:hypothetical protein
LVRFHLLYLYTNPVHICLNGFCWINTKKISYLEQLQLSLAVGSLKSQIPATVSSLIVSDDLKSINIIFNS